MNVSEDADAEVMVRLLNSFALRFEPPKTSIPLLPARVTVPVPALQDAEFVERSV